jgi:hypothetical protein
MFEIIFWVLSMFIAGNRAYHLSTNIAIAHYDRLTISENNAKVLSRTFKSNAISYFIAAPVIGALATTIPTVLEQWWVLEIFIFWNLRSAWIYHVASRRFQWSSSPQ